MPFEPSPTSLRAPGRALSPLWRIWPAWRPIWRQRARLRGELVTIVGLLAIAIVNGLGYPALARAMAARGVTAWDPICALDRWIPALPWTVALYTTMYLYYPLGVWCAPKSDRGRLELCLHVQGQVMLALISYVIFFLLPAEIHLTTAMKERLVDEPGWIRGLFAGVYAVDRPWNAWPSLHVSQSLFVVLTLRHWLTSSVPGRRPWMPTARAGRIAMAFLWIAWTAMALSILTTKQHFVWDGLTGVLLALSVWRFYFQPALGPVQELAPRLTGST